MVAQATSQTESDGRRERLRAEGLAQLLQASRYNFVLEPLGSVVIAAALWGHLDKRQAGLWLMLVWGAAALRWLLAQHIHRIDPQGPSLRDWGLAVAAATAFSGGLWASGLWFLWPQAATQAQLLLAATTVGVGAASAIVAARHGPTAYAYLLAAGPVGIAGVIWRNDAESLLWLAGAATACAAVALVAWHVSRLRLDGAGLRLDLDAAHEAAETASRTKTEFVANMSHELRTPLNAILGFSEIIKDQVFGPIAKDQYVEYAHDIHKSGSHLLEVINDILDISRVETGNMRIADEEVDVSEVIGMAIDLIKGAAEQAGVEVRTIIPDPAPSMHGDRRVLRQVLMNLVSNAVKFTALGGEVVVEAKFAPNDDLMVITRDTGIGMMAEDIQLAMTPFGQVDSSLARRYEGTGLGLPLVRSMVELLGGDFRLQSEPSVGTTAICRFPASVICR